MAWSSIVRVLLLALFAWELRLAASKDEPPAFMREQTKAKSNQFDRKNPGARQRGPPPGRGPPEGMPEPEVMDQHGVPSKGRKKRRRLKKTSKQNRLKIIRKKE